MTKIRFTVTAVAHRTSSEVATVYYTYPEAEVSELKPEPEQVPTTRRVNGAEWEEIEFAVEREEKPAIQIANVVGNALLVGNPKLIINNPELFGTFKDGDVIEFEPVRVKELVKSN